MSDSVTKSKNVSMSRECGDAVTASPRPSLIEKLEQLDGKLGEAVAIHEALVAERDRLRGLVRRLAHVAQDTLYFAEAMCGIIPDNPERAKARSEIEALLAEARSAIGEDAP